MGAQGTATLDFGAFPGGSDATVAVTGQGTILSGSLVEAWLLPADTTDHKSDEHLVESIDIYAGNIVASTGFTIYGVNDGSLIDPSTNKGTRIYGKWNIAWVWN